MKYGGTVRKMALRMSPSMRREWIEIPFLPLMVAVVIVVSLHAEGVD